MAQGQVIEDGTVGQVMAQTEVLRGAEVEPPQMARLAQALRLNATPLTPEEFVRVYRERS